MFEKVLGDGRRDRMTHIEAYSAEGFIIGLAFAYQSGNIKGVGNTPEASERQRIQLGGCGISQFSVSVHKYAIVELEVCA